MAQRLAAEGIEPRGLGWLKDVPAVQEAGAADPDLAASPTHRALPWGCLSLRAAVSSGEWSCPLGDGEV